MIRNSLYVLAVSLLLSLTVSAQNEKIFYLSEAGNDSYPGTAQSPWHDFNQSVDKVLKYLQNHHNNAVLIIKDGVYPLNKTISINGSAMKGHLRIAAEHRGKVVIDGRCRLTSFSKVSADELRGRVESQVASHLLKCDLSGYPLLLTSPVDYDHHFDLYLNSSRQQVARWPNAGYTYISEVHGSTAAEYGGFKEGIFKCVDKHITKYKSLKDVYAYGYWHWDWSDQYSSVQSISHDGTVQLSFPYHYYGYKKGARFCILNSIQDLDMPGEYYVDKAGKMLYWYPPKGYSAEDDVWLSSFNDINMVVVDHADNLSIDGLVFIGGRKNAISISGGNHCNIENCRISCFGGNGVLVNGGRNHSIKGCLIENVGEDAISLSGGDRRNLAGAGFVVDNNKISGFALFRRTMKYGIESRGCGIIISHNDISDSPAEAILLDGNNMLVEKNKVYDVVKVNTDNGYLDMYRDPSYRGNVIRSNYWRGYKQSRDSVSAIRLDDMISGVEIAGNIFDECGTPYFAAVQINGGRDNAIHDNLFYHCSSAVSFSHWSDELWQRTLNSDVIQNLIHKNVDINSSVYRKAYPSLSNLKKRDIGNKIADNLVIGNNSLFMRGYDSNRVSGNQILKSANRQTVFSRYGFEDMGVVQNIYK